MRNRRFRSKLRRAKLGDTIRVYVASLEAYNRGRLVGKWLELPMDELELEEEIEALPGEEWAIHDFEAPFKIDEYTDIFELNETAQLIEDSGLESEIIGCLIDNFGLDYLDTALIDLVVVEASDETDLAHEMIDDLYGGVENMPEDQIANYFDYEAFGRDLAVNYLQCGKYFLRVD